MCASCSSLILILLTSSRMVAEGLPLSRQEHGTHQDIIAGADFLTVLMDSSALYEKHALSSTTTESSNTHNTTMQKLHINSPKPVIRELRYPRSTETVEFPNPTPFPINVSSQVFAISDQEHIKLSRSSEKNSTKQFSAVNKTNAGLVVSVQISSSEGDSHINKISPDFKIADDAKHKNNEVEQDAIHRFNKMQGGFVASEEYPSLVAESSRSDFSVDETEPVTSSTEIEGNTREYPANIQAISNSQFQNKDKLEPYGHHSVVYHDEPSELIRGRSVSYSTVIQSIPKPHGIHINSKDSSDKWVDTNHNFKERQERHLELKKGPNDNTFDDNNKSDKTDFQTFNKNSPNEMSSSVAATNDYFVTARYESSQNYQKYFSNEGWKKPGLGFISDSTDRRNQPTEKYWGEMEKPLEHTQTYMRSIIDPKRQRIPVIYGKPEQNYEVDESVSVQSNGRVHGVQPNKIQLSGSSVENKSDTNNDNQKVGYVVEGRNYRKYRVEERTSDGFIVGEYGVVSHDDGSLRGVRYTADGTINPRLIYDALMKFLSL